MAPTIKTMEDLFEHLIGYSDPLNKNTAEANLDNNAVLYFLSWKLKTPHSHYTEKRNWEIIKKMFPGYAQKVQKRGERVHSMIQLTYKVEALLKGSVGEEKNFRAIKSLIASLKDYYLKKNKKTNHHMARPSIFNRRQSETTNQEKINLTP